MPYFELHSQIETLFVHNSFNIACFKGFSTGTDLVIININSIKPKESDMKKKSLTKKALSVVFFSILAAQLGGFLMVTLGLF